MLTFHNNLITFLERSLAEITRLGHGFPLETHLAARVLDDILTLEEAIADVGFHELEYEPYQQENNQGNHDANGYELNHWTVTNNDRAVDRTE
jgi:hypothetical protein